jgi:hypothetical protein
MEPLFAGCRGSVRQNGQPIEQAWLHHRQGWPAPPTARAEPIWQLLLSAQVQVIPPATVPPFIIAGTWPSIELRGTGITRLLWAKAENMAKPAIAVGIFRAVRVPVHSLFVLAVIWLLFYVWKCTRNNSNPETSRRGSATRAPPANVACFG